MDQIKIDVERDPVPEEFRTNPHVVTFDKITPRQREYLLSLITRKQYNDREGKTDLIMKALRISEDPEEFGMSKKQASILIDWFAGKDDKPKDQLPQGKTPGAWVDVPAGRYAVDSNEGELRFYQVWRPKDNAAIFRLYVLHGPDSSQVHRNAVDAIMGKIADNARAAAIRYGMEIGSCSNCGRRLTNRISRELGIGPVCGGRMFGSDFKDMERDKRVEIINRGEDPDEELE